LGLKKIFGEEASKPMLIDFLASLLPETHIVDLTFKDKEKLGKSAEDRKAVYDIYCENNKGEKIIIELQKANRSGDRQNYFKDRTVFYATFPIQEQSKTGDWNYELKAVFCVGILDFTFEDKKKTKDGEVIHTVQLKDQNNQLFYDKLKFVYLEMPHFTKEENQLETRLDKWLYFIKHLEDFQNIPEIFKDEVFIQAFEKAEIAKYTDEERSDYEDSLKIYRDYKNTIDTAFDDGQIQRTLEIGRKGKLMGLSTDDLMKLTGLTKYEIDRL
jgi:predicted transposase/invertase (TIGR01784 family)